MQGFRFINYARSARTKKKGSEMPTHQTLFKSAVRKVLKDEGFTQYKPAPRPEAGFDVLHTVDLQTIVRHHVSDGLSVEYLSRDIPALEKHWNVFLDLGQKCLVLTEKEEEG